MKQHTNWKFSYIFNFFNILTLLLRITLKVLLEKRNKTTFHTILLTKHEYTMSEQ